MLPLPSATVPGYDTGEDTTRYADWIESCALFTGERVSKSDVRDYFYEENTFQRGDADVTVANIWSELTRRNHLLSSSYPISIGENGIEANRRWQEIPGYSFTLVISYAKSNPDWEKQWCSDYTIHGQLFEKLSAAAIKAKFSGWDIDLIGWSPENPTLLKSQITDICSRLEETLGHELPSYTDKDGGIDLVCSYPFKDGRGNHPAFFIQCATGRNWVDKRYVDTQNLWTNWIGYRAPRIITRGFAIPFLLNDDAFRQTQVRVNGLVLDRVRLFKQIRPESDWLPQPVKELLLGWLEHRVPNLIEEN